MVREAPSHTAFRDCAGSSGRTFWTLGTAHTSISVPNAHVETAKSTSATFNSRKRLKLGAIGVSSWNINLTGVVSAYYSMPGPPVRMQRTASPQMKFHDRQFFDGEANIRRIRTRGSCRHVIRFLRYNRCRN